MEQTTEDGEVVGRVRTLMPYFPSDPIGRTRVAMLWPLLDRPHRLLDGDSKKPVFTDDSLGASVISGTPASYSLWAVASACASTYLGKCHVIV